MEKPYKIISRFILDGSVERISLIGSGHINDSYLVLTTPDECSDYVLQRINHNIFRDVEALTSNILTVTGHLKRRVESAGSDLSWFRVISLVPAPDGCHYYRDPDGDYWRMYDHVRGSVSHDLLETPAMAREAGRAFGAFLHLSSGVDLSTLHETLPDFHNIATRLEAFSITVDRDPAGRVGGVSAEISFVRDRAEEMHTILRLGEAGKIPLRVTHNDTKCNNVLFDDAGRAIAVVDLDTVMPGYMLYDFGDAIRTGASTGAEDEPDLAKVSIDLDLFKAYAEGYLGMAGGSLVPAELDHLAFSAKYMTFLIGLRFLTDHIDGDRYYKTAFPGHNLQRARAQFRLVESMEENFPEMQKIITTI